MPRKKKTKAKTPRQLSSRKRTRTAKGMYYDQHLGVSNETGDNNENVSTGLCEKPVLITAENAGSSNLQDIRGTKTPEVINSETPYIPDTVVHLTNDSDIPAATPIGIMHVNNTISLKRELEQALTPTSYAAERLEASTPGSFKFPKSVVTVDASIVKEIDFNINEKEHAYDDDEERIFVLLNNVYELYELSSSKRVGDEVTKAQVEVVAQKSEVEVKTDSTVSASKDHESETIAGGVAINREYLQGFRLQMEDSDMLKTQIFQKQQQLKVANDRIEQLQNTNNYRKAVQKLEGKILGGRIG